MTRRVAITGIGAVTPGAPGTRGFWETVTGGKPTFRTITSFDPARFRSRVAAEVDFDPDRHGLTSRQRRRMDRAAQFAVVAAREALADGGLLLSDLDPVRTGVTVGSAVGCTVSLEREYAVVSDSGRLAVVDPAYASPHLPDYLVPASLAREVAWDAGAEGPACLVSTGCTSGLDAVAHGTEIIRDGGADVMLAGAADAPISPITVACFDAIKATSPDNDDPEHACRPFDATRAGFVLGEGAAMLVLEDLDAARARGVHVYAEIRGFASRCNAFHMTGLRPDGAEMAAAIEAALDEARIPADGVDYVNAHGSGTRQNDRHETAAIKRGLGEHAYRLPVSSIKSVVGHSLGAIGAIEVAASALAIDHDLVPPTANLHHPDPECDLDYVPVCAREQRVETVLSVGSGFGGFQSAMVLSAPGRWG
ncbi:beta-ketoacyl-[acyl-carrier-protein] synthase family protein [Actinomadura rubrisoli]|uniref:Beta-ketoacyl-[acyl-carrier-protein] synthase family protein n=1 Tax=Actinomadura rubrisoli TaxID=2530368 RepID=A0A4R5BWU4_9ACTN|nr:beta-ketoacyl-[acyl-carrier-protein] synthase family protein [Actinomadura rubrisoli]TDD89850.1 beta-ketoacyl-[acyl-carrier-protein] synthase family protein [Actinomadura rubrisoli]